jgi:DNA polymerase III subunit epsilon
MEWLTQLFRPTVELAPELVQRLQAWRDIAAVDERDSMRSARFVVVDVESSGLNVRKDRLLSIGAVAVNAGRLAAGDGFDVVLRSDEKSGRENILIHGIGPSAQRAGVEPEEALMDFLEYLGKQPLVAFHAGFDEEMIGRRLRSTLGVRLPNLWLDLALLAPAVVPGARLMRAGLDDWLNYFGLRVLSRHRAADDAFATAELFLILLARARARGVETVGALRGVCERQARLAPGGGAGGA